MFELEQQLVDSFLEAVYQNGPFVPLSHMIEFNYQCGRADILIRDSKNKIIAFEAKLHKWRDALHQAYRCSNFANYSYVLLPNQKAKMACEHFDEFNKRRVGLCTIIDNKVVVIIRAPHKWPVQKWLTQNAHESLLSRGVNEYFNFTGCCY